MGLRDTCTSHPDEQATGRCRVCHKPTCPACRPRDGCCSQACYESKARFAHLEHAPRPRAWPYRTVAAFALLVLGVVFRHDLLRLARSLLDLLP